MSIPQKRMQGIAARLLKVFALHAALNAATQGAFDAVGRLATKLSNIAARDAVHLDAHIAQNLVALIIVDSGANASEAAIGKRRALIEHVFRGIAHRKAVNVDDAVFDGLTEFNDAVRHLERIAVFAHKDMARVNTRGLSEIRMSAKMHRLAMHRHEVLRLHDRKHELELFCTRVARHVNHGAVLVPHIATNLGKLVHDARNSFLIARNGRRGNDDRVAFVNLGMVLCSPFAIRASAESGSPWLPVHIMTTFSGGIPFRS